MLRFQFKYHVVCSALYVQACDSECLRCSMHDEELRVSTKVFGVVSNTVKFRVNFRLNDAAFRSKANCYVLCSIELDSLPPNGI